MTNKTYTYMYMMFYKYKQKNKHDIWKIVSYNFTSFPVKNHKIFCFIST